MPSKKAKKSEDAIAILKADHRKVKELFDQFDEASASTKKQEIVAGGIGITDNRSSGRVGC
jgi:hypothetical protein